ncbi:endolytic transglycosylase MltG [Kocuria koreensis]|uniref:Endolytic murein transglycosylase n=1 Tax=Rothia koreensis TaxID=592378 RepID=A0A7K1LH45_9MICC|nr:endolytic transglycosylase MltG [Rothia koreensis]MUN54393.1 endolytic transglycosylase MltG [Rothia koreensis]
MSEDSSRQRRGESSGDDNESFHGLFSPTEAERRAGVRGLRIEQEHLTPEQARRRYARRRQVLVSATIVFVIAFVVSASILGPRMGLFEVKDYHGDGNGKNVSITVSQGDSNASVGQRLEQKGVIANSEKFVDVMEDKASNKFIQPGTFELQEHMSSESAMNSLIGSGSAKHYVAISQNQRKDETFDALAKGTGISVDEFKALDNDPGQFGVPDKFTSLEGFLHPGEYRFDADASAKDVVQEMVDKTKKDLKNAGVKGDDRIFHVVTVASILEFEGTPKDYKGVAGAIENRIDNPDGETQGFLQSDATVAYGLGKKTYQISDEQKQDASNGYNTFANKGLPQGPIGSPASNAIKAAAHPEKNDYYYWVTVNLDTGETKFAKTYDEHQKNVDEYDQWCSEHEGKCV